MTRLPLTVIGGYLGAGKTTFINGLLAGDHGKRLMVMVNDFGAVNVDAALIRAQGADTLELTNGCVCCTMGADLYMAVGDVLDRGQWPDHLIIEASGVADPAKIAEVARNEPELCYAGIVTVVDGLNWAGLMQDAQIAPQVAAQVEVADLLYLTKTAEGPAGIEAERLLKDAAQVEALMWDLEPDLPAHANGHAHFTRWQGAQGAALPRPALAAKLAARPVGLYRVKGFLRLAGGEMAEVQVVGKSVEVMRSGFDGPEGLVGIGPQGAVDLAEITTWWEAV